MSKLELKGLLVALVVAVFAAGVVASVKSPPGQPRRPLVTVRSMDPRDPTHEGVRRVHVDSALAVACYSAGPGTLSCVWTPEVAQ